MYRIIIIKKLYIFYVKLILGEPQNRNYTFRMSSKLSFPTPFHALKHPNCAKIFYIMGEGAIVCVVKVIATFVDCINATS